MILKDKRIDSIKSKIPENLCNRLINRKNRVVEKEKKIRINMIKKLCIVNSDEDLEAILNGIEPLWRNKKRSNLLMIGHYEEVNMETEKAIVTCTFALPKETEKNV